MVCGKANSSLSEDLTLLTATYNDDSPIIKLVHLMHVKSQKKNIT
jgi:hypothetical protein